MDNTLKPTGMSYAQQVHGSLFSWRTSRLIYQTIKECQVANFHAQSSDGYAYA